MLSNKLQYVNITFNWSEASGHCLLSHIVTLTTTLIHITV